MPIYTPRGLKIRIDPLAAFAILSRLEPRVRPFRVLKTVEAIESLPAMFAFAAAAICALYELGWQTVLVSAGGAGILGGVVGVSGLFVLPGVLPIARLYSYVSGLGVLLVVLCTTLWWRSGIAAVGAFAAARLLSGLINGAINSVGASKAHKQFGQALQASEFAFFAAAVYHFGELGRKADLNYDVQSDELPAKQCLERFAQEWPEVASRIEFT
jgi:hypothetical protein